MKKEETTPIYHPHDRLFKTMLSTPEVAIDLLKARLEPHMLEALDLSSFRLEDSSFIDEKSKQTHSHLLFSLRHKDQKEQC